jgi:MFS family permease
VTETGDVDLDDGATRSDRAVFARFVGAHVAGAAGDALVAIALSGTLFFDVSATQARSKVGLYLLLTMAPFAVLSPVIGPFLDRRRGSRRLAVIVSCAGRAAACLAMASTFRTLLLYPLAFVVLVMSRSANVARAALVPSIVGDRRVLVTANARLARAAVVGGMLVALPGIVLLKAAGERAVLDFALVVYLAGTVAAVGLPRPRRAPEDPPSSPHLDPPIRRAAGVQAAVRCLAGFLLFLLAFGLKRSGVSSAGFGFVLACAGAGGFAGAVVVPRLRRSGNEEWIIAVALLGGGGVSLIAGNSFGLDLAAVLAGAVGVVGSATRLAFDSIVQRRAPEASRGRTFARFETTFQIAWVAGAGVPVAAPIGVRGGLLAAAVLYAATAVWFLAGLGRGGRARLVTGPPDPGPF